MKKYPIYLLSLLVLLNLSAQEIAVFCHHDKLQAISGQEPVIKLVSSKTKRLTGGNVQQTEINIIGEGIGNTGIVSSYKPYQFRAESTNGTISGYSWKYELLDTNKEYVTIKSGDASIFSIDPVANESLYDRNPDGDFQGRVTLEANINGTVYKQTFSLYLEVKPVFNSVEIDAITPDAAGDFYDLEVTVMYSGVDYLYYEFSQEFSYKVATDFIREPYQSHLYFKGVNMGGESPA